MPSAVAVSRPYRPPVRNRVALDAFVAALASFVVLAGTYGVYDVLMAPQANGRDSQASLSAGTRRASGGLLGSVFAHGGMELCPGKQQVNILVLGTDEKREGGRADTIMLVMLRKDTKRAAAVSIPRDLKVRIPGYGYQKINAVYAFNRRKGTGEIMTLRTVEEMFRRQVGYPLDIDFYIKTDVTRFPKLFDAVGGLDLYVDRDMKYRDNYGGLDIDLKKGFQHLNGKQIEGFVRHRKDWRGRASSDYMRNQRQQYVLKELVKQKAKPATVTRLPQVVHALREMVSTNMTVAELAALGLLARELDLDNTISRVIATRPEHSSAWYAILLPGETKARMEEVDAALSGGEIAPDKDVEADPTIGGGPERSEAGGTEETED
ncbi:MAG: LCP family protein [Armatimonadetes bacterium]|nr:LCP family protein [Armatimonadota bacterium]